MSRAPIYSETRAANGNCNVANELKFICVPYFRDDAYASEFICEVKDMPDFEDLRLSDLIEKFRRTIEQISATRSLSLMKTAGAQLQSVYDFFITAEKDYAKQQELLKSMFSSFNYAAVIVNNALKCGKLTGDDSELLNECIEIMLKCCANVEASLKN